MELHPIWSGIMIGLNLQTSFLTPPFGFALFYLGGVAPRLVTIIEIYKGVAIFVTVQVLALGVVTLFPDLTTWPAKTIFGLEGTIGHFRLHPNADFQRRQYIRSVRFSL